MGHEKKEEGIRIEITKYLFYLLVFLIAFSIFFSGLEKSCSDEACFNEMVKKCSRANFKVDNDGHLFLYTIEGNSKKDFCVISVRLEKLSESTDAKLTDKFLGKEMTCNIPYEFLDVIQVTNDQKIMDYCSGPLKEAMLEFMIEKLYGSIAQNFGGILAELEQK